MRKVKPINHGSKEDTLSLLFDGSTLFCKATNVLMGYITSVLSFW